MSRSVITCAEPGCTNQIAYDPKNDLHVHLYCPKHRTIGGRHAAVRILKKAEPIVKKEKPIDAQDAIVVLRCPKCHLRREVSQMTWKRDAPIICECGRNMTYHKTIGDEHISGGAE
jgi:hypothetical protein